VSPRPGEGRGRFSFCPICGAPLDDALLHGRQRPRCAVCGFVQWRNPVTGVAAVIREEDVLGLLGEKAVRRGQWDPAWRADPESRALLLVRRARSRRGLWCLPCGYVEYDEEIRDALVREVEEETGLTIRAGEVAAVHSNFHDPARQSVGIWFRATPVGGVLKPADDVDAVGFFPPSSPPDLAFPTDTIVLRALAAESGR
jgi:ADP-ribose pyrophosphatase YjhB (NUDIX family)